MPNKKNQTGGRKIPARRSVAWAEQCLWHAEARLREAGARHPGREKTLWAAADVLRRCELSRERVIGVYFTDRWMNTSWQANLLYAQYWAALAELHLRAARRDLAGQPALLAKVTRVMGVLTEIVALNKKVRTWVKPHHRVEFKKMLHSDLDRRSKELIRQAQEEHRAAMRLSQLVILGG